MATAMEENKYLLSSMSKNEIQEICTSSEF